MQISLLFQINIPKSRDKVQKQNFGNIIICFCNIVLPGLDAYIRKALKACDFKAFSSTVRLTKAMCLIHETGLYSSPPDSFSSGSEVKSASKKSSWRKPLVFLSSSISFFIAAICSYAAVTSVTVCAKFSSGLFLRCS